MSLPFGSLKPREENDMGYTPPPPPAVQPRGVTHIEDVRRAMELERQYREADRIADELVKQFADLLGEPDRPIAQSSEPRAE